MFRKLLVLSVLFLAACDNTLPAEHLSQAKTHFEAHELNVAVIELKNAIQKDPQLAEARSLLAEIYLEQGDLQGAEKEIDRAIQLGLNGSHERLIDLRTELKLGRYSNVIESLEQESTLSPEFAVLLGEAYISTQDLERAKPLISQGLDLREGLVAMAVIAELENDRPRAITLATEATEMAAHYGPAWLIKAENELILEDLSSALTSFKRAANLPGTSVFGSMGVIRTHLASDDLVAARTATDELIRRAAQYPPAQYLAGLVAFRENDLEAAESALRIVQSASPDHIPTLYLLGVVKAQHGQLNQAISNLRRFVNAEPNNISARKVLASIYGQLQDYEEVKALLSETARQTDDPQIWAMLGGALTQLGDMGGATDAFQKAVELAPDTVPFRNQLAISLLSSGEEEQALSELNIAVELDGDQLQSDFILALSHLRNGDIAAARESIASIIAKSPDNPIGHNLFGVLEFTNQDFDAARIHFEKALSIDASYYPARDYLAQIAEQTNDLVAAHQLYLEGVQLEGGSENAVLGLVSYLVRQGEIREALDRLEQAVVSYPNSIRAHLGYVSLLTATRQFSKAQETVTKLQEFATDEPPVLLAQANLYVLSGNIAKAKPVVTKLQTYADQFRSNSQFMATLGGLQLRAGDLALARTNLEAALEGNLNSPAARVSLAKLELLEGNNAVAEHNLEILEESGVTSEEIEELRGNVLLQKGELDDAIAHFKDMQEAGSRTGTFRYALLSGSQGNFAKSEEIMEEWLESNPSDEGAKMVSANLGIQAGRLDRAQAQYEGMMPTENPVVLNNLAWIYLENGDDRAETIARQAHANQPQNPDIADTLGWILVHAGKADEAIELLRSSARAKPGSGEILYHLGVAHHRVGDIPKSIAALNSAIETGTDFDGKSEAETLLETLQ